MSMATSLVTFCASQAHWKNMPVVTFLQNVITLLLAQFVTLS